MRTLKLLRKTHAHCDCAVKIYTGAHWLRSHTKLSDKATQHHQESHADFQMLKVFFSTSITAPRSSLTATGGLARLQDIPGISFE